MDPTQELTTSEREELKRLREIVKENEQKESIKIKHAQIEKETNKFVNETCQVVRESVKKDLADYYSKNIKETIEYIEWDLLQLQRFVSKARLEMREEFEKLSPEAQTLTKQYDWQDLGSIEYDIQTLEEMIEFLKSKKKF